MLVDLVVHYSKQTEQRKRVRTAAGLAADSWPERPVVAIVPFRVEQRLAPTDIEQMVEDYRAGATGRELAARFGLARSTVIDLLKERGVDVRHPRLTDAQTAQVVKWYREGVRQIDIAERIGRHKSVVWHLLRRAGEA